MTPSTATNRRLNRYLQKDIDSTGTGFIAAARQLEEAMQAPGFALTKDTEAAIKNLHSYAARFSRLVEAAQQASDITS